ncbi:hypothetical protein HN51_012639 [Arachis hypogaea]|uniref:C2 NT-type domain-containing protein n=2 Tax=Arachis TaxID=3817 RepID=A0A445DTN0_ARAHY|nr:uncharacterized protein LOC107479983 [Arachis duranensis]XP_025689339.1 myosin-11 [Arachis hypogaea]QHO58152.1 uncharacterized protein DS421_3g88280 [Arachis hypogaea]RYR66523.1 hypothetical protein Ahy_A03g012536 [Arachis hypogaea]
MFRPARWRTDKNKVKAVFKLQFHVTQMLQSGVDALVLSIVPVDIGKATTRLDKASVNGGICRWDNPVYETVKFVQDSKTGKFTERIYYFVLSTGLSKASTIGEVSIDFADYAEATKPSSVSLPFKNSRCDAVLHVSIQRLQENNDKREEEECEDGKIKHDANNNNKSLRTYLTNGHADESTRSDASEDVSAKSNTRGAELSADCRTSSGSDLTLSSSEGSGGLDTPREHGVRNASIQPNTNGFVSPPGHPQDPQNPAANATVYDVQQRPQWGWLAASEHGLSTDNSTNDSQDALPKEGSQPAADMEIERLKAELTAIARQKDMSDLELQTLKKQIIKESKKGQDLSKEIMSLKEERDALKAECENLKSFHKRMEEAKASTKSLLDTGDLRTLVEEIRQELSYEKDLNANLRLQLNKTQESNAELVLAVQDLDEMLEQKNKEIYNLSNNHEPNKNSHEMERKSSKYETEDDEDQKELEELAREHSDAKETYLLEQKILDLYGEIELYKRDKDELEMQMEQLALDYEILKQENHDIAYKLEQNQLQEQLKIQYECSSPPPAIEGIESHTESLENQLKNQSEELSNSMATIKELEDQVCKLEAQISKLEEEMEKQARGFESDVDALRRDKAEQEQRAIQAEEALRKSRSTESHIKSLESQLMKESEELSHSLATIKILEAQISRLEEQLEKQADEFEVDLDAVTRDKIEQEQRAIHAEEALQNVTSTVESLENQLVKQSDELSNSQATIKVREAQISRLEEKMEKQARGFEAELDTVMCNKVEQEQRAINAEEALQESRSTERCIEVLENQLKKQSEELSDSLATIKVLETQISRLEEEMEKQAHGFETDLDAVTRDKIEQEQRAIRAEEILRKTRLRNANTAERLQEEFKRLSVQMASTFDANEKATMRAMKEASELRARKRLVEQMLHKVKEELHSVKGDYEVKLIGLSNQIDVMTVKIQQMSLEIEDKSKQLENQKNHDEQVSSDFPEEMQNLKAENERLKAEISCFSEHLVQQETLRTELEAMKKSVEESETLLQRKTVERNELVITIVLLKEEAEQLLDELSKMRDLKNEKETVGSRDLQSELEELRAQYDALKRSLSEDEAEIEKLRKQIFQLKGELKKKDDALANNEKKLKDRNGHTQLSDGAKTSPKNKKSAPNSQNSKEMASLREKVKMLEALIKSKETALETSTSSFLEKERELQSKIEELEDKVEEFSQSIALQTVVEDKCVTVEPPNDSACVSGQNGAAAALSLSKSDANSLEKEADMSRVDNGDGNLCSDMLTELLLLKERNKLMENELKEIQERYSEMSLKFAEVEGERQKLVMTVRYLKNSRKGGQ